MTLISKLFIPEFEVDPVGLKEIQMSRLGRLVALSGKNGAGKSRILNSLESIVNVRFDGVDKIFDIESSVTDLQGTIRNNPQHTNIKNWREAIEKIDESLTVNTPMNMVLLFSTLRI
jgi:ABC-type phosphate/phosphonate transport system ATPase subunit